MDKYAFYQYKNLCGKMFTMGKVEEIYYENAYIEEFDAVVTGCNELPDGDFGICLDRTAFFPEQGGQSSDFGVLVCGGEEIKVSKVSKTSDGEIIHEANKGISVGSKVHGHIDFEHRFSNMQQHSAEHIFSGIVNSMFGYDNVGFHLSDQEVTMDYNGSLSAEDISKVEMLVNEAIYKNVKVTASFPSDEELKEIPYRSKKELSGAIRIVTIDGYDICACCAPHVNRTGEIGILKVVSLQNYKGGVRVSILCGKRALLYLSAEHDIVKELSGKLTTSSDNIISSFERLQNDNSDLKQELSKAREEILVYELSKIPADTRNVFIVKDKDFDNNTARKAVNILTASHEGFCGVLSGSDADGYRFIFGSGTGNADVRLVLNALKDKFEVRGGGNDKMVQGSVSGALADELLDFLNTRTQC